MIIRIILDILIILLILLLQKQFHSFKTSKSFTVSSFSGCWNNGHRIWTRRYRLCKKCKLKQARIAFHQGRTNLYKAHGNIPTNLINKTLSRSTSPPWISLDFWTCLFLVHIGQVRAFCACRNEQRWRGQETNICFCMSSWFSTGANRVVQQSTRCCSESSARGLIESFSTEKVCLYLAVFIFLLILIFLIIWTILIILSSGIT